MTKCSESDFSQHAYWYHRGISASDGYTSTRRSFGSLQSSFCATTDVVEASITVASEPSEIRILDGAGEEVLSQITGYDSTTGKLSFIFKATVASLGYATYEIRLNETSELSSSLKITETTLENDRYLVTLNARTGDVRQIKDKKLDKLLLRMPIQMLLFDDRSDSFPAWEIVYETLNNTPSYVDENVKIEIVENGG